MFPSGQEQKETPMSSARQMSVRVARQLAQERPFGYY